MHVERSATAGTSCASESVPIQFSSERNAVEMHEKGALLLS